MRARIVLLLVASVVGLAAGVAVAPDRAAGQEDAPTTTTQPTTTTEALAPSSTADEFRKAFWRIVLLTLIVSGVWVIPVVIDLFKAYRYQERLLTLFESLTVKMTPENRPLSVDELTGLFATRLVPTSPSGITGLARSLMALTIATAIGIALIVFIAIGSSGDRTLVRTIVTTLLAAFTTIIGFYFGARTAEGASAAGAETVATAHAAGVALGGGGPGGTGGAVSGGGGGAGPGGGGDEAVGGSEPGSAVDETSAGSGGAGPAGGAPSGGGAGAGGGSESAASGDGLGAGDELGTTKDVVADDEVGAPAQMGVGEEFGAAADVAAGEELDTADDIATGADEATGVVPVDSEGGDADEEAAPPK